MPAFASALDCGMSCRRDEPSPPGPSAWLVVAMAAVVALCGMTIGCDDELDEKMAIRHAEANARFIADDTIVYAREWVLLHPQSDRQRHAREQLLRLQELEEKMPDTDSDGVEQQIDFIHRWRDAVTSPHQEPR